MEWPDGTQDATRLGEDWRAHALAQLATQDFRGVAHGFREAAEAVYNALGSRSPDALYLPLQYLWRHQLELMLKANIWIWSRVTGNRAEPTTGHDLRVLFRNFVELSSGVVSGQDAADTAAGEQALETFLALEPHHDASRYPEDRLGRRYERPERVDLHELHRAAKSVSSLLGGAYDQADALLYETPEDQW